MTKEIKIIADETKDVVKYAKNISINNPVELKQAIETLTSLNSWNDRVVEDREKLTKPLLATLKEIRERYKPLEDSLNASIQAVRSEMTRYQGQALKERQEAELRLVGRVERGTMKMDTALRKLEKVGEVESTVGAVSFVELAKFEVVDLSLVPIKYHLPDMTAIRTAMKAGVELAGVRYFKEQSVRNRRDA